MQNSNIKLRLCSYILNVGLLLSIFFLGGKGVYASTYHEIIPGINPDVNGNVGLPTTVPNICTHGGAYGGTVFGQILYAGIYPDTSSVVDYTGNNAACSVIFQTPFWQDMQHSWGHGTMNLSDGDYWVAITFNGSAGSPDFSTDVYWWSGTRSAGVWSGVIPPSGDTGDITSRPYINSIYPYPDFSTTTTSHITFETQGLYYATSTVRWNLKNLDTNKFYTVESETLYPQENKDFTVSTSTSYISSYAAGTSCGITPGATCARTATSTLEDGTYQGTVTITDVTGQSYSVDANFQIGYSLFTVYQPSTGILPNGRTFLNASTSPVDEKNLISFLNVPYLLKTKEPFAYIFQIGNSMINAMSTTTTTVNMQSISMSVKFTPNQATTTLTLFSTTTVTSLLGTDIVSLLRSIMAMITYITLGFGLFKLAMNSKFLK